MVAQPRQVNNLHPSFSPDGNTLGVLDGVALLSAGPLPSPQEVENTTDPEVCGRVHNLDDLLVSPGRRGIANVIVSLIGVPSEHFPAPDPDHFVLDNRNCRFVPHAAVLTSGTIIELTNSDLTLHTVHLYGPSQDNISLPFQGMSVSKRLLAEGIYQVKCDVHGWMQAFIRVDTHPFHSVTDSSGTFQISGIPAGNYALEAWHERLGFHRSPVEIRAGKTTNVEFEFVNPEGD
jgi:plastocyanin